MDAIHDTERDNKRKLTWITYVKVQLFTRHQNRRRLIIVIYGCCVSKIISGTDLIKKCISYEVDFKED